MLFTNKKITGTNSYRGSINSEINISINHYNVDEINTVEITQATDILSIIRTGGNFFLHFGGHQEHHNMKIDFTFKKDSKGTEFLTFAEGITKIKQSGIHEKSRLVQPKMLAIGAGRCSAAFFKTYLSKHQELRESGNFNLSVISTGRISYNEHVIIFF